MLLTLDYNLSITLPPWSDIGDIAMSSSPDTAERSRSFSHYLFFAMVLLALVVVIGITVVEYSYAERNLQENEFLLRIQTESTIRENIQVVDDSLKLYDATLNQELFDAFSLFLEEYERSGRNPAQMDLGAIKDQLQDRMDLYIINASGVVEFTTFLPDRGLDFSTVPYFFEYIDRIRQIDGFYPDRIVVEPASGNLRKYAYMPTPDHQYLFELGLTGSELEEERSKFHYHEKIKTLTSLNPYVQEFRIFTSRKQLETNRSFVPNEKLSGILDTVIGERRDLEVQDPENGTRTTYLFVDLKDEQYGSDVSRIVEITYNAHLIDQKLSNLVFFHLLIAVIVLTLVSLLSVFLSRRITRPIQEMVTDINLIAEGDPNRTISTRKKTGRFPSRILSRSIGFSLFILAYMVLIIVITVGCITAIDVISAEQTFTEDARTIRDQTEGSLTQTVQLVDEGYRLYDDSLNKDMREGFSLFLEEYERSYRDVSRMNLGKIKEELGSTMDLYIINESLVIEYTTFPPDLGLDFSQYPYTQKYLSELLQKNGFYPDRIVRETSTGNFRKFAYMPTPDHRYIFELGLSGEIFKERHGKLSYSDAIQSIASRDPYILQVRPFDTTRHMVDNFSYKPDSTEMDALSETITNRETIQVEDPENGFIKRYLFIEVIDPQYASDMSWILEIAYDTERIQAALNGLLLFHGMVAMVALTLSVVGALLVSRFLTRPVQQIIQDARIIAAGDLDHSITTTKGNEFEVMEESINLMVRKLRANIDQLKKSKDELRQSEKKFKDLVGLLPQVVFETDLEGRILFANQYAFDLFGYTMDDFKRGLTVVDAIPVEEKDRLIDNFQRSLKGVFPAGTEYTMKRKDGTTFPGMVYAAPILENNQLAGLRGVLIDITQLKQVEEEIRILNEDLESRVRDRTVALETANRELESFTYSVSHDLRAPLRAIDGFSGILIERFKNDLPQEAQRYLEKVRLNTQQMANLIDDLLNFSRMSRQPLQKELVEPNDLVREVYLELHPELEKKRVEFILQDLPTCQADRGMLRQVFQNLLSNALKFTRTNETPRIEVGAIEKEGRTVFYVQDNGIGFDMRYANKLFGVFQRLHSSTEYEGTGVGLAIVQKIIQMHGGRIWAESNLGKGTIFYFTLEEPDTTSAE